MSLGALGLDTGIDLFENRSGDMEREDMGELGDAVMARAVVGG